MSSLTLGELLSQLKVQNPAFDVQFDFGRVRPLEIDSWRGSYDRLAIGYSCSKSPFTVRDLILKLEQAKNKEHRGYKGGSYKMDEHTEVYVDNYGECTNTIIVGIREQYETVYILTQKEW